jgi:tetratricopeptide (TPR) repeat protein
MLLPALLGLSLLAAAPAPVVVVTDIPDTGSSAAAPYIASGVAQYRRLRFRAARDEFEKAVAADPQSAAAEYYLGYSLYKIGEPTRRLTPEKEASKGHFARAFELNPLFVPHWSNP